jgi:hypothetical protein
VTCATLDGGDGFIRAAMDDYLAVEIHTERVIVYAHDCKVCYSEALDGSLHPNGYFAEKEPGKAKHGGKLHATEHSRYFCVGIFARVYDRVTYIRPASQKIELKRVGFDIYDKSPAARLNAFIGLSLDANERTPYMPYTDEAADFFTNMMTGMCELARKLDDFLGDREKLELAISRQALLLGAPAA